MDRANRRRENHIINKNLVIIPDPSETNIPTHHKRAKLRMEGLITDEYPFDKRWSDDELLLNVREQLPLSLSMHRLRFVKASFGTLTPIKLADGVPLTCKRLLRISGQGAVYAQVLPTSNDQINAGHTAVNDNEDGETTDNLTVIHAPELLQQSYSSASDSTLSGAINDSTASTTSVEIDSNEIYSAIKGIFPDTPDELLRQCANENSDIHGAVDAVLNGDKSLSEIMDEVKKRIDFEQPIKITVQRERIWRDCLSFYKVAMVERRQLFRELKIEFKGEDGVDCGALKLEFFQIGFAEAKKVLLEDIGETMIPKKTSVSLLAFKVLGTFIGHSILQGGPGIQCFPGWVFAFISTGEFQASAEMIYSEKQIPLNAATASLHTLIDEIRNANTQEQLDNLLDESTPTGQINAQIVNNSSWDITRYIRVQDRDELIFELIVDELLRKRLAQLTSIRQGLEISGILRYIILHPQIMLKLFLPEPKIKKEAIHASLDSARLQPGSKQYQVFQWFLQFVDTASEETLHKFLQFATSLTSVAPNGIYPKIDVSFHATEEKIYPEAAVCFRQLFLPICHGTYEDFANCIEQALLLGSEGFGLI